MQKERLYEIVRFGIVGVLATAIHYVVYCLLLGIVGHNLAFTIGYVVSFFCNYVLSSHFTFNVPMSVNKLMGFGMSHLTNYLIQMCLLNVFLWLGVKEIIAPLPVYAVAVPINYLLVRFVLKRQSKANDSYVMFLIIVGLAMLGLNMLDAPTLSDDIIYRFVWSADDSAPVQTIDSLVDLMRSQVTHYNTVNGRFVVHTLAQFFLAFLPPLVLQLVNSLLFVVMIHFTVLWVKGGKKMHIAEGHGFSQQSGSALTIAVVSCFLLFIVFQGFRTTMVWSLGSFNYLWVTVMVLALLLWMRHRQWSAGEGRVEAIDWLLSPLAFFAGCSHEALSLPVSVAMVVFYLVGRTAKRSSVTVKSALVPYMLWFVAGMAVCLLSPGIISRSGDAVSLQARLLSGVINYVSNIRVLWLLLISLIVLWRRDKEVVKSHLRENSLSYVALLVSAAIVFVCGTNLERVGFYTDLIAMLLLLRLLFTRDMAGVTVNSRWQRWIVVCCCLMMALFYIPAYLVRAENMKVWQSVDRQMKEPGRELVSVELPRAESYFSSHYVNPSVSFGFYSSYMAFDCNDINMRCLARLYDKERVYLLPADVVRRIESDSTAYSSYELDDSGTLYVWKMEGNKTQDGGGEVKGVTFVLRDEDPSMLLPHQRLVAYSGNEYDLDDFNFEVVKVCGHDYLVFTRPTTNIYRRIKDVRLKK